VHLREFAETYVQVELHPALGVAAAGGAHAAPRGRTVTGPPATTGGRPGTDG